MKEKQERGSFFRNVGISPERGLQLDKLVKHTTMSLIAASQDGAIYSHDVYNKCLAYISDPKEREVLAYIVGYHVGLHTLTQLLESRAVRLPDEVGRQIGELLVKAMESSTSGTMSVDGDGNLKF